MILVFGTTGQVATELQRIGGVTAIGRDEADLSDPALCDAAIRRYAPKTVINAAAYTAVDKAESEETLATVVNGDAPAQMAKTCADLSIPLVHISTDYVFEGGGTVPWTTDSATGPLGAYGRSKLVGEQGIAAAGGRTAILRTSWVFSAHGSNFLKTMLRLGAERDKLTIVADQIGGPTPAADIAQACLALGEALHRDENVGGLYHFSGAPDASWADFAREIFVQADLDCAVEDIPTSAYPTPAVRPLNSRLDCSRIKDHLGIERPDWRYAVGTIVKELTS